MIRINISPLKSSILDDVSDEKHPQCKSIPLIYACDKINIKNINMAIERIDTPSKNTPNIKQRPSINSNHGTTKAIMFSTPTGNTW